MDGTTRPARIVLATFYCIQNVIFLRSQDEMGRVYARWVVTFMAHDEFTRINSVRDKIGHP